MEVMSYDFNVYVESAAGLSLILTNLDSLSICSRDFIFGKYDG